MPAGNKIPSDSDVNAMNSRQLLRWQHTGDVLAATIWRRKQANTQLKIKLINHAIGGKMMNSERNNLLVSSFDTIYILVIG